MTTRLRVGDAFPDFELPDHKKRLSRLSEYTRPSPLDETEGKYARTAQPYTFVLRPDLMVHRIYDGWFFVGRPTLEETFRAGGERDRPDGPQHPPEVAYRRRHFRMRAVFPGKKSSIHLEDLPDSGVEYIPDGRGMFVVAAVAVLLDWVQSDHSFNNSSRALPWTSAGGRVPSRAAMVGATSTSPGFRATPPTRTPAPEIRSGTRISRVLPCPPRGASSSGPGGPKPQGALASTTKLPSLSLACKASKSDASRSREIWVS